MLTKAQMGTVTAVDPHWLAELGGVFYSIKERGTLGSISRRCRDTELNRIVEIESQFQRDRERAEQEEDTIELERRKLPSHSSGQTSSRGGGGIATAGIGPPKRCLLYTSPSPRD